MQEPITTVGAPVGIQVGPPIKRKFRVRTAVTKGDVMALDITLSDGDSDTYQEGAEGSAFTSMVVPDATAHLLDGLTPLGVAMESIAIDEEGEFLLYGPAKTVLRDTAGDVIGTVGDKLIVKAGAGEADVNQAATPGRVCGYLTEAANVTDVTATETNYFWDGLNWLGTT